MSFKEEDIRPSEFNDRLQLELAKDIETLQAHKSEFTEVPCPACGDAESVPAFSKYGFDFAACSSCKTAYMSPRATPEIMSDFYASSRVYEFWNKHIFPATQKTRRKNIFKPRAEHVVELCKTYGIEGNLMDVGAATGLFCLEATETDHFDRVIAVELNQDQATSCREAGLETISRDIAEVDDFAGSMNVISSFEVIEHLFSPQGFLENCRRMLAPGGLIVISCPNYHGFDIQTLGVDSESLDAEHINMFNPDSLELLFRRCGFEVLECTTPGQLDADIVRGQALKGAADLSGQPFLHSVLIERWDELGERFQDFLKESRLSSHMWLAARKVD